MKSMEFPIIGEQKPKTDIYEFKHDFRDGTVGRYETREELNKAIEEENENRDE